MMKKRILIVEDDFISFSVGKVLFEQAQADCEVTHAESGEEAIDLFAQSMVEEKPYDGIYMDIGLPKMSGIEVCISIREYETEAAFPPVLIIAVTGNNDAETAKQCLSAGMMDVFIKPLSKDKVVGFLSKCPK